MKIEIDVEEVVLEPFEPFIEVPYIVGTTNPTRTISLYKKWCKSAKKALSSYPERFQQWKGTLISFRHNIITKVWNDPSIIYLKKC